MKIDICMTCRRRFGRLRDAPGVLSERYDLGMISDGAWASWLQGRIAVTNMVTNATGSFGTCKSQAAFYKFTVLRKVPPRLDFILT